MDIRNSFAESKRNHAMPIRSLESNFLGWVLRYEDWYGVAIPLNKDLIISERFSNVKLWSHVMSIGGIETPLLLLTSTIESLRYEFASVCTQFVDPGKDGLERYKIINNPSEWWSRWKELLGNSVQEKTTYSVLGEMLAYEMLIIEGKKPNWSALKGSTHDIEMEEASYEIKSTINRYDAIVTINSQFQLQYTGKELNLIFCRFEQSEIGISTLDMVERLVSKGVERELLNKGLNKMGLEQGCSARLEKYKLLEIRKYSVDNSFPTINANSFLDHKLPKGVIQITYKVDLIGLKYENWKNGDICF